MRYLVIVSSLSSLIFIAVAVFLIVRSEDSVFSIFVTLAVIGIAISFLFISPVFFLAFKNQKNDKDSDRKKSTDNTDAL